MYDAAYSRLEHHDVEIVVHADHPTLNRSVADMLGAGERLDVISTHGKYTPSQAQWLQPLDSLVPPEVVAGLSPKAVDLCRANGLIYSLPRVIDVRLLWVQAGVTVPDTWADVVNSGMSFGMPGRESGLFGTFFELVVGAGGRLLSDGVALDRDIALDAIDTLCQLAAAAPAELSKWHYDGVDAALMSGAVVAAAAWPGSTSQLRAAPVELEPHPYPAGPVRRVTYSGCHSWAIPATCGDLDAAVALVTDLCSAEVQALDAATGSVCANLDAFAAVEPIDAIDARRLALTREAIATQMITYPPLAQFPEIEDPGWMALRDVLVGTCTPTSAVDRIAAAIASVTS